MNQFYLGRRFIVRELVTVDDSDATFDDSDEVDEEEDQIGDDDSADEEDVIEL